MTSLRPVAVLVCAVILVTAPVAPALSAALPSAPTDQYSRPAAQNDTATDQTAHGLKQAAIAQLEETELQGASSSGQPRGERGDNGSNKGKSRNGDNNRGDRNHQDTTTEDSNAEQNQGSSAFKQQRLTWLNDSLTYFIDGNHISDNRAFELDRKAVASLAQRAPDVAELVVSSDRKLARTAIDDAAHVADLLDQRGVDYDRQHVNAELEAARDAYQQAEHLREKNGNTAAEAIMKYQKAWLHAQRALDLLDRATTPVVTITSRQDPAHNGSINYTVTGTVFDVRTHQLDTLTLSLNGETRTVSFPRNTTPGSVDTFQTTISLTEQINMVTVTATDPGTVKGDVGKPLHAPEQTSSDMLKLDGDRLPDHYEERVLGMDPLDPDSDASPTADSEADDGIRDDRADLDADNATNYREYVLGIEPLNPDTDGDDLLDGFEIWVTETNPNATDTDGDNVSDAAEDFEPDGLDNLREQNYSTDPYDPDTDADNLSDGVEVDRFDTDPLDADTDGDDLEDGIEIFRYGTDPLDNDTDGDNLTDSGEIEEYDTSPLQVDTDSDNLSDWSEISVHGTNATQADTDHDDVTDGQEVETLLTDPTVADSDSSATRADEANDGTVDGAEDLDDDSVRNSREFRIGTETLNPDTDGDQLLDGFEIQYAGIDALTPQTDNDSVEDAAEDLDADNLTNLEEQRHDTHPNRTDTDQDRLDDVVEIDEYGTEPTLPDTDGDGLNDSEELDLGTDPTLADTDGDGTIDSNEMFTTSTMDKETGVTLNVTGEGNVAENVTVETDNRTRFNTDGFENVTATKVVDLQSNSNFESANVTISYNKSEISKGSESDLAVYRYNESLQTFVRVNSTVDTSANTVSAETKHFSTYTVLSKEVWRDRFEDPLPSNWTTIDDFDSLSNWSCEGANDCTNQDSSVTIGNGGSSSSQSIRSADASNTSSTSMPCAEFVGGDPDCDDDGVKNWNDECPNRYGEKANGCPEEEDDKDDDNDGVLDKYDDCPNQYGEGPNGCPETDPEETWLNRTISLSGNVETIVLRSQLSSAANSDGSFARFVIRTDDGTSKVIHEVSQGPTPETSSQTVEVDISEFAGQDVTLSVYTVGDAYITLYSLDLKRDTDGDGIFDNVETDPCGIRDGLGNCISTDVTEVDSDEDQLDDDREIGAKRRVTDAGKYYTLVSHPNDGDTDRDRLPDGEEVIGNKSDPWKINTDSDGLDDFREVRGWEVHVSTESAHGKPYEWDPDSSRTKEWNSSAWKADTDGDGLTDFAEYNETHTNPQANVTYGVTIEHEKQIYDRLATAWEKNPGEHSDLRETAIALNVLDDRSMDGLGEVELTDASDDFDFVQTDSDRISFTSLDGTVRTDVWLSNEEEIDRGLSTWDADTDNDGLTDGQEVLGLTKSNLLALSSVRDDPNYALETEPDAADTDGDEYWDGWIGVYGTNDSRNVILYRHHLYDDDDRDLSSTEGVQGSETVPEQAGTHEMKASIPSATSADVDGDGVHEHSNIHIGELHWGTDPTNRGSQPSPSFTIEVDFHAQSNTAYWQNTSNGVKSDWAARIEDNYALYGIETTMITDEVLSNREIDNATQRPTRGPFSVSEFARVNGHFHDRPSTQYLLLANESDLVSYLGSDWQPGLNTYVLGRALELLGHSSDPPGMIIFTDNTGHPRKTAMHEIAHSYQIGEADDNCLKRPLKAGEIYSGESMDPTPETVDNDVLWSTMSSGWSPQLNDQPMNGDYYAFSIEELFTATPKIDPPCV